MTFVIQVVVKTRTEYQTEKKRLKVPKVEEFTISFTDGVSERLKVRESVGKGENKRRLCHPSVRQLRVRTADAPS